MARYSDEHIAAIQAGAARGDQGAILALARLNLEAQQEKPATIQVGTNFLPPTTPRVDGREITVDITTLK